MTQKVIKWLQLIHEIKLQQQQQRQQLIDGGEDLHLSFNGKTINGIKLSKICIFIYDIYIIQRIAFVTFPTIRFAASSLLLCKQFFRCWYMYLAKVVKKFCPANVSFD